MATGETGFEDVTYDLISVQYHALKAGRDYGQYVRDAQNAGLNDIAQLHLKVPCLVAGMAAGADSIDDMGAPRGALPVSPA